MPHCDHFSRHKHGTWSMCQNHQPRVLQSEQTATTKMLHFLPGTSSSLCDWKGLENNTKGPTYKNCCCSLRTTQPTTITGRRSFRPISLCTEGFFILQVAKVHNRRPARTIMNGWASHIIVGVVLVCSSTLKHGNYQEDDVSIWKERNRIRLSSSSSPYHQKETLIVGFRELLSSLSIAPSGPRRIFCDWE